MTQKLHPALTKMMASHLHDEGVTDLRSLQKLTFKELWRAHGPASIDPAGKPKLIFPGAEDLFSLLKAMQKLGLKLKDFDLAQLESLEDSSFLEAHEKDFSDKRVVNMLWHAGMRSRIGFDLLTVDDIAEGMDGFGPKAKAQLTEFLKAHKNAD